MDAASKQAGNQIAEQETPQIKKLRVAAYARSHYWPDDPSDSLDEKKRYYSELIHSHDDWTFAGIYAEVGRACESPDQRQEFQRMMDDCRSGKIDRIIVRSLSRFARNTIDGLAAIKELKELGVSVFFENGNIDTALPSYEKFSAAFLALAKAESENISMGSRHLDYPRRPRQK